MRRLVGQQSPGVILIIRIVALIGRQPNGLAIGFGFITAYTDFDAKAIANGGRDDGERVV